MNILLIDDDASLRRTTRIGLEAMEHRVTEARNGTQALELLGHRAFQVALLGFAPGRGRGACLAAATAGVFARLAGRDHHGVCHDRDGRRGDAARARPTICPSLSLPANFAWCWSGLPACGTWNRPSTNWRNRFARRFRKSTCRPKNLAMRGALELAFKAAASDAALLIRGESGTGKGVLARAIHARSRRARRTLRHGRLPSLSAELLESELFGHVQGAFTGATRDTTGKVAAAEGGTLFLDEIGDLPLALQPKLLRLLQEKQYERVGETRTRACDVRVLAATNRNLEQEIAAGRFREDLFYRLNVIELTLPALARAAARYLAARRTFGEVLCPPERQDDRGLHRRSAKGTCSIIPGPETFASCATAIERAVILTSQPSLGLADLPASVGQPTASGVEVGLRVTLEQLEQEHVRRILGCHLDDRRSGRGAGH